jgi:hypothetical protein
MLPTDGAEMAINSFEYWRLSLFLIANFHPDYTLLCAFVRACGLTEN